MKKSESQKTIYVVMVTGYGKPTKIIGLYSAYKQAEQVFNKIHEKLQREHPEMDVTLLSRQLDTTDLAGI